MKIGSKTETATLAAYGLEPCLFVFVLESIYALAPHGVGAYTTVLKSVEPHLVYAWISTWSLGPILGPMYAFWFERKCAMLPPRWKELYRYFSSFMLTEDSYLSIDWTNTPFSYSGRLSTERYRVLRGVKKAVIRDFVKSIQANSEHYLRCWLLTDAGDALFLDEEKRDGKVYHVKDDNFADHQVLNDPEAVLDHYLAHYVTTQSPEGFDFRA